MAMVAAFDLDPRQYDVLKSYYHAKLDQRVYCHPPDGMGVDGDKLLVKVWIEGGSLDPDRMLRSERKEEVDFYLSSTVPIISSSFPQAHIDSFLDLPYTSVFCFPSDLTFPRLCFNPVYINTFIQRLLESKVAFNLFVLTLELLHMLLPPLSPSSLALPHGTQQSEQSRRPKYRRA